MSAANLKKLNAACRAAERRYMAADRLVYQCLHTGERAYQAARALRDALQAERDACDAAYLAASR